MNSWKNISIGNKQGIGFGVVIALIIVLLFTSYSDINLSVKDAKSVITANKLDAFFAKIEVGHLHWAGEVAALLTNDNVTDLNVELDYRKCKFGQWLYGGGKEKALKIVPSLEPLLNEIQEPHRLIHDSAKKIKDLYVDADEELPVFLVEKETDHLKWIQKISEALLGNLPQIDVITDPNKCNLGQWIYGEKGRLVSQYGSEFKKLMDELVTVHAELHKSAAEIKQIYKAPHPELFHSLIDLLDSFQEWSDSVAFSIVKEEKLQIELDPDKCDFGKFLSAKQTQNWMNEIPEFKSAMQKANLAHNKLHNSVKKINNNIISGNSILANQTYLNDTTPALQALMKSIREAFKIEDELDHRKEKALKIYNTKTLSLLDKSLGLLNELRAAAESRLKGKRKAKQIYQEETVPSLKQVGEYLTQIRKEVKKGIISDEKLVEHAEESKHEILIEGVIILIIAIFMAFIITRSIVKPLQKTVEFSGYIAEGNFTKTLDIDQKDEVGQLAEAMKTVAKNLGKMIIHLKDDVKILQTASGELSTVSDQLYSGAQTVSGNINSVAAATEQMSSNMTSISNATDQTSSNVNIVASAAEEMSATISEIAENSEKARTITSKAVTQAQNSSERVDELGKAAKEIGTVTETITDISEQTNLLALNATIEAARAGEAGKGFAVVANEIKELAKQTASATDEIKKQIDGIQGSTNQTVTEIEEISKVISDINDIVGTIAAAIEEQTAVTKDIAENVAHASMGIQEVTSNVNETTTASGEVAKSMAGVSSATGEFTTGSSNIKNNAEELNRLAENLSKMVSRFIV